MVLKGIISKAASNIVVKNGFIVLIGSMAANVLSYIYHLVMGRLLGPAGYGELSSLLSILYIFTVPLAVAQFVLVKFISGFKAHGEEGQTKSLFIKATKLFAIFSLVGVPIMLVSAPWVTEFLHLSSSFLFILVYILLVTSLLTVTTSSVLTGYQKFIWVSMMSAMSILIKLIISIPFAQWRVPGVMIASVISGVIVYGIYFIPLRFLYRLKKKPTNLTRHTAFAYAIPTLLTQLGITSMYSSDIILVRHYFSAYDAGLYAALAILGKVIFYASSAIPTVLFPIASERSAVGTGTRKLVVSASLAVVVISGVITALYFLAPGFIIKLLFGNAYAGGESLLGRFAIFLALFSVGNILSIANLAIGKVRIWFIPILAAIIQIIGIMLFHSTIEQIILLNIIIASLFAAGAAAYYLYEKV